MDNSPTLRNDNLKEFTDPFKADEFAQLFLCSACWGQLTKVMSRDEQGKRHYSMQCEECKDKTPGYILRRTAERKAEQSRMDLITARHTLREAGLPWLKVERKTERQILAEIGY